MIDRVKQAEQRAIIMQECIALSKEHKHFLLQLPTRTGKGLCIAQCIRASDSVKKWVVLVPEILQIESYKRDLYKHNNEDLLDTHIEDIMCYASIDKLEGREVNVCCNEVHRVSQHRMDVLKTVNFDQILSDSATVNQIVEERLNEIYPFYKYSKTLQEVIDLGILPQPEIICIAVELDKEQRKDYDKLCKTIELWDLRYNIEGYDWQRIKYLNAGSARKRFLSACKTSKAKQLLETLKDKRYICYTGSVSQAKELGGKYAVHGKNKNNQQILDDFNNCITDRVFACGMIQEGITVNDTQIVVIVQLDNTDRTFIQRSGRILTGDEPIIYLLYCQNTRDESYLKNAITDLDKQYIKHIQ